MTLPRICPIPPTWHKQPFDDPEWVFDFKYDGFLALLYIEKVCYRFISRNGNLMHRFDELAGQVVDAIEVDIDGEIIAADETDRPQFYELLRPTGTDGLPEAPGTVRVTLTSMSSGPIVK